MTKIEIACNFTEFTYHIYVQTNLFGEQPETLLLAIQKDGLALINAADKVMAAILIERII